MALQGWDKNYREQLKIQEQEIESLQQQLVIGRRERPAENPPPGGNPGRPPWPGYPNPMPPGKDWPSAGLQINPNSIMVPFVPKDAETDEDYGEGEIEGYPGWKMSHGEGRGPQAPYHDEYNQPLDIPPWMQVFPDGKVREIPWMKEKYLNEHPELKISDHRGLTNYLDSQGRSGRTGSFKDSGLSQEKLIEALKIGLQVMKA